MNRLVCVTSILSLASLAGCGPMQPKRSELAEKEIAQCIAGMAGLIPDEAQRKIVCECTADAKFNVQLDAAAADKCREKAGMNPNDPFGILKNDSSSGSQDEETIRYSNMP